MPKNECKNCGHDLYYEEGNEEDGETFYVEAGWCHKSPFYNKEMDKVFHDDVCRCTNPQPKED